MENSVTIKQRISWITKKYMMEIILVFFIIFLALSAPNFATLPNLLNILRNVALTGIISFGMTMTIIGGEIDLSVGSAIGFSSVITATVAGYLAKMNILPLDYAVVVGMGGAILIGLIIGFINGYIRTKFEIPTFIITLAMLNVIFGVGALLSRGFPVTTLPEWFSWVGAGRLFGFFPVPAVWLLIVFAIVFVIMNLTKFGREVYAVGGNAESARLSGIHVAGVKILIMMIVQALAAVSGIILAGQVMSGSATFGRGYELDVIAAVIIGGTSLFGGIGKVWGTMVGILFLGIINNGMTLFGVGDYEKYVVRGLLILFAVLFNTIQLQSLQKTRLAK